MSPELDRKLCESFPKLYRDRRAPMNQTCMCWGFDVGDGWFNIIWNLSTLLEPLCNDEVCAMQVKEKFGGLRFYMTSETEEITKLIQIAKDNAAITCEECGALGSLRSGGWLRTLCDEHYEERNR